MKSIKNKLQHAKDIRSNLVNWVPLFDRDHQYTRNHKAYIAISWLIGVSVILIGLFVFVTAELPHLGWKEASVLFRTPTESSCTIKTESKKASESTYRYSYVVDGRVYTSTDAYCEEIRGTTKVIYNPSNPSDATPANRSKPGAVSLWLVLVGGAFILFAYLVTYLSQRYYHRLRR